jgi:hypothetical protein
VLPLQNWVYHEFQKTHQGLQYTDKLPLKSIDQKEALIESGKVVAVNIACIGNDSILETNSTGLYLLRKVFL